MSKVRATIGVDGRPLPVLPPERDARVWAKLVRVMFYTPGFMALLLVEGKPEAFGISVELLMLSSAAAIVGGIFIGKQSSKEGADPASKIGTWCGSLVLELLAVVPLMCVFPLLFHQLAQSRLLHAVLPGSIDITRGATGLLPMVGIPPFMLYQLAGFGTISYIVPRPVNWAINIIMLGLIIASYVANREGALEIEKRCSAILVVIMAFTVLYGILKLKQLQTTWDAQCPPKASK